MDAPAAQGAADWNLTATLTSPQVVALIVALGTGLLIGVERERRKGEGPTRGAAGVRTFVVVSLCGAVAALFETPWLVIAGFVVVGLLAAASYLRSKEDDPGLTTEVALVMAYLLGALAQRAPQLAAGLGALVALLLAARGFLHDFVRRRLSDREVFDGLLLAGATLVILPLMPDRAVDPLGAVNPYVVWQLTVIVLLINAFGYIAQRALGPQRGLPLAGFFGGFVSSAATIAALGARRREHPAWSRACDAGAALSNVATIVQMTLVVGVVYPALLGRLWPALLAMVVVASLAGLLGWRRVDGAAAGVVTGRAFQPRQALVFSITVTTVLAAAAALERMLGAMGALVGIALGGFADAHSAAASAAALAQRAAMTDDWAALAVLIALSTNTATKLVVAATTGGRSYLTGLLPPLLLMLAAGWAGLLGPVLLRGAG